jgi:hypothetical protein
MRSYLLRTNLGGGRLVLSRRLRGWLLVTRADSISASAELSDRASSAATSGCGAASAERFCFFVDERAVPNGGIGISTVSLIVLLI